MHNVLFILADLPVDLTYHIASAAFTFLGAFLLGFANEKVFNGSIWPSILLHGLGNTTSYILEAFQVY